MSQKFILQCYSYPFSTKQRKYIAQDSQCYDSNFLQWVWLYSSNGCCCSFSTFAVALEGGKRIATTREKNMARSKRKVQQSQLYYEQCTLYTIYILIHKFFFILLLCCYHSSITDSADNVPKIGPFCVSKLKSKFYSYFRA